jgi:hypothetical protein
MIMKKLLHLFLAISFFGCGSGDDSSSSSSAPNNVPYFFEIEFGGEVYRVEGETNTLNPTAGNTCYASSWTINLGIGDPTANNYVTGGYMGCQLGLSGPFVGSDNSASLPYGSFGVIEYLESIGAQWAYGFYEGAPANYGDPNANTLTNINITDLGTAGLAFYQEGCGATTIGTHCWGEAIKGSYSGVLYYTSATQFPNYNIPVPIRIEFSAPRYN